MVYSPDLLTHIVDVHWGGGGGVFIAINQDGNIYYLEIEDREGQEPAWEDLGTLGFVGSDPDHFIPYPSGCSFALIDVKDGAGNVVGKKPAFVLVGGSGNTTSPGIIKASRDGKNWSDVFTYPNNGVRQSSVWAVVWDEEARSFFAAGHTANVDEHTNSETDLLFSSSDGFSWGEVGSRTVTISIDVPVEPWPEDSAGLLDPHCSKRVLTFQGYGTPDGNYGYDKEGKILIKPDRQMSINYLFGNLGYSFGTGVIVESSALPPPPDTPPPPTIPTNPGISGVTCVATAGGVWVVAGGAYDPEGGNQPPRGGGRSEAAYLTTDDKGNSVWRRLNPPGTNAIIAMCAGLLSDVEPSP